MFRLRIEYKKLDPLRFTSVLDMQRLWERTFRRAEIQLAHTQGFHPAPKIHLGAPLPLGFLSNCELMDVWLLFEQTISEITSRLRAVTPPGIHISTLTFIDQKTPFLQSFIQKAEYMVTAWKAMEPKVIKDQIETFLRLNSLTWNRRSKDFDLRSQVLHMELSPSNDFPTILMQLSASESNTGRPDEVMEALGYSRLDFDYLRTAITLFDHKNTP